MCWMITDVQGDDIDYLINTDIRCWIDIEFWSPDVATKILPNINVLWRCVSAGIRLSWRNYYNFNFS